MKNKYDNLYYWEQIIKERDDVFLSIFKDETITPESVFFHGTVVNTDSINSIDTWFCFPEEKAMLGFIKYIYMPTVFFMFLSGEEELKFLCADGSELLDIMESNKNINNIDMIPEMRAFMKTIYNISNANDSFILNELRSFSDVFQETFNKSYEQFAYFKVFKTPSEVGEYILDCYKDDGNVDISDIESQLGVRAEEWRNIVKTSMKMHL